MSQIKNTVRTGAPYFLLHHSLIEICGNDAYNKGRDNPLLPRQAGGETVANKEQKKVQKAAPKSNKQKKEAMKEKKAAKSSKTQ